MCVVFLGVPILLLQTSLVLKSTDNVPVDRQEVKYSLTRDNGLFSFNSIMLGAVDACSGTPLMADREVCL